MGKNFTGPRVLVIDIETAHILANTWHIHNPYIKWSNIEKDWCILSFCAKWLHEKKLIYMDNRKRKDPRNDRKLLLAIRSLLHKADVIITKNGTRFDVRKINARLAILEVDPPSPYQHIDLEKTTRKNFAFSSNTLAYLTDRLCKKYKKLDHKEFPGDELQLECVKRNPKAWRCMEEYNKYDVLSTEELYLVLRKWRGHSVNFGIYMDTDKILCPECGSNQVTFSGVREYKGRGFFRRYRCKNCLSWSQSAINGMTKEKKRALLK